MDVKKFQRLFNRVVDNVNKVIHGKDDVVRLVLTAMVSNGHILFDDVPGVGKSMLAKAFQKSIRGSESSRVQCTPDMLPGDITGSSVIEPKTMKFTFRPGPVFANILLVDETNRATPKTQSAMLEAMAERAVTVDGTSYPLPNPFLVLATQNPVELAGTFPLPEAQLDRFLFKLRIGYPDLEAERKVLRGNAFGLEVDTLDAVAELGDILEMQELAVEVDMSTAIETYILELVAATRVDPALSLPNSPRASIALARTARTMAAADGRDHVYPEDVRAVAGPVMLHRMICTPDATLRGETQSDVLERIVGRVKAPLGVRGGDVSTRAETTRRSAPVLEDADDSLDGDREPVAAGGRRGRRNR